MSWTPESHIAKKKVLADQLTAQLRKMGLVVECPDYNPKGINNVTISNEKKTFKLSHHNYYRFSGIATTQVGKVQKNKDDKKDYILKEMTDSMFYTLLKGIILHCLKPNEA